MAVVTVCTACLSIEHCGSCFAEINQLLKWLEILIRKWKWRVSS